MTLVVVAPTDAQLAYIADLCRKQGLRPPPAIHSADAFSEGRSAYDPANDVD